jgi:predicted glycoside hydrolase/deacetylase ChbG (UPF0249 family)
MSETSGARHVIVNADDFGLTEGINRGIVEAHESGIVTSASLMVRYPAAKRAAEEAKSHPRLSIGLHFEISEWRYRDGEWEIAYQVADARDSNAVEHELRRQLEAFEQLVGRAPTHLDSHQHAHKSEPVHAIMVRASEQLHVPLRSFHPVIKHCGNFYGQTAEGAPFAPGISTSRLIEIIDQMEPGWTEIGCHPGYAIELDSVYACEREEELRVLCNPKVRTALERKRVQLSSFQDYLRGRDSIAN